MSEKDEIETKKDEIETNNSEKDLNIEGDIAYKIVNIVATVIVDIETPLELTKIAQIQENVEYSPERFPGLVMRIKKPHATLLIFSTGKMVVTGLKKTTDASKVVQKAIKNIQKSGFKVKNPVITIQNIVATGDLDINIDLNMMTIVMENIMYEPEIFPGLIYRMQDPKCVFLIFSTGKIVCLGAKKKEIIHVAILKLNREVRESGVAKKSLESIDYEELSFF